MKDKEQTKRKLIDAVGEIIQSYGFDAVRISKVARIAGVDRKLIYRYFGNLNNLVESYVTENDYWMLFYDHLRMLVKDLDSSNNQQVITQILQELFIYFSAEKKMQQLILSELSTDNPMMRSIHNTRESLGQLFLESTDDHFAKSTVNFRAVAALLVGGIYYSILHTRSNGNKVADMNVKDEAGKSAITDTLAQIVDWAFAAAR